MNKLKYSILLVFLPFLGFSQTNLIQGNVKDKVGEPIPGVTILVKGTSIGTTTDIDGNFVIDTKDQKLGIIKFSYLGFSNKEIRFNENLKEIDVILDESIHTIELAKCFKNLLASSLSNSNINLEIDSKSDHSSL